MINQLKLILLFCVIAQPLFAQMNISTNLRQDGYWDEAKEEWVVISTDEEEFTFFEFNDEYTMFKHTTPSITSAYIIKSRKEDEEKEQFELTIVSDVGNKYNMVIDFKNRNLRFVYAKGDYLLMVQHDMKKVWFDDDDEEEYEEEEEVEEEED
jgi:hypothetical protein